MQLFIRLCVCLIWLILGICPSPVAAQNCPESGCAQGMSEGYTQLKAFAASQQQGPVEFTYVLSKDTDYLLSLCDQAGQPVSVRLTVLGANGQTLFINQEKKGKPLMPRVGYYSQATSVVTFRLEPGKEVQGCYALALGFRAL